MLYNIKKIFGNLNSGSDDGCDGNKTLFFLSINPKHDMKLFCGFTQIVHKLFTNCTCGQLLYKVGTIYVNLQTIIWFN